ncbi:SDR family NAD(P)-dependent oxidoreductase [Streptosporangium carneum]|uniref:7-alpha-hydroxysteroid dehydrogenase n=1 Tax=Streptosporangium carneum TaxID=47481 RepID=A0A9W6I8S8_9ACTN|nr:SDR family NAD(P)-dependent oxidoreductase [Streptosporangium carneum]GLK14190.1 7-alpha-hydroxysteroid dehydrogenase [Streptosporangium carneum]
MDRLRDKVVIITGAGSGIGRAAAELMSREGASVLVADHDAAAARAVADGIGDGGGRAASCTVDVTDDDSVAAMVETAVREYGRLDVLCNHVGGTDPRRDLDLLRLDMVEFQRAVDLNVRSTLTGTRHALPHLIDAGGGSIVNTASVAGLLGDALQTAYGAVKAAVINITRYVAVQYGPQGVRCNAVAPGAVMTPALRDNLPVEAIERLEGHNALPYLGTPEDIGHAMLFLASEESRYMTGQVLVVDGGMTCQAPTAPDRRDLLPPVQ